MLRLPSEPQRRSRLPIVSHGNELLLLFKVDLVDSVCRRANLFLGSAAERAREPGSMPRTVLARRTKLRATRFAAATLNAAGSSDILLTNFGHSDDTCLRCRKIGFLVTERQNSSLPKDIRFHAACWFQSPETKKELMSGQSQVILKVLDLSFSVTLRRKQ